ncbi:MAG: LysR family transcriptional regulator [Halioglobus sp.]
MDLRQIRNFVAVAEAKSLSAAVDRLDIDQPALSVNIKNLEQDLGAQLFNRSRRGMELTDAGKAFLGHAYRILEEVAEAQYSVSNLDKKPEGKVSIATPPSLAHAITVPLYNYVHERFPGIELDLEEGLKSNLLTAFELEQLDILVNYDLPRPKSQSIFPLLHENLYLVSPIGSGAELTENDIAFRELEKHTVLFPSGRNTLGKLIQEYASEYGVQLASPSIHTSYHQTVLLLQAGLTSAILPWSAVHDLVGRVVTARRIVSPEITREISIATPVNRALSVAAQHVLMAIKTVIVDLWLDEKMRGHLLIDANQHSSSSDPKS